MSGTQTRSNQSDICRLIWRNLPARKIIITERQRIEKICQMDRGTKRIHCEVQNSTLPPPLLPTTTTICPLLKCHCDENFRIHCFCIFWIFKWYLLTCPSRFVQQAREDFFFSRFFPRIFRPPLVNHVPATPLGLAALWRHTPNQLGSHGVFCFYISM